MKKPNRYAEVEASRCRATLPVRVWPANRCVLPVSHEGNHRDWRGAEWWP